MVKLHDAVKDYVDSSENSALATKISSEILQLSRAVVKKHTFDSEKAHKFYLAQKARMLSRCCGHWHKLMQRKIKRKTQAIKPWTVFFSWNLPFELFDCLEVAALPPESRTRGIFPAKEIRLLLLYTVEGFFIFCNKYAKGTIKESCVFIKTEKDGSYSQILVTENHTAIFK